jgi:hypothetical protein
VHVVVQGIPAGVLTGEALDDAVDEISRGIQEARTVERPYVVLDPRPERGYTKKSSLTSLYRTRQPLTLKPRVT